MTVLRFHFESLIIINRLINFDEQIIQDVDQAQISLKNVTNEYPIRDQYRSLRDRNVTLILKYRSMPITGIMHTHEAASSVFHSPNNYFRQERKGKKSRKP